MPTTGPMELMIARLKYGRGACRSDLTQNSGDEVLLQLLLDRGLNCSNAKGAIRYVRA